MKSQEIDSLLEDLLFYTNQRLIEFAQSDEFNSVLAVSFGAEDDTTTMETLQETLLSGGFFNGIEVAVLPSETLQGALGAYAATTNTIYLSQGLLESSLEAATAVLLEETGHAIDAALNLTDSLGDEGAIFASLLQGEGLRDELREEDDRATLNLDGELVTVEQAEFEVTTAEDIPVDGSLRGAIVRANAIPGTDTITFDGSLAGETILLNEALSITDSLIIEASETGGMTIDAQGNSRVFLIDDGNSENAIQVSMDGLTITGGNTEDNGAGIWNRETLNLTNTTISGNSASGYGGGIHNRSSTVNLTNSTISGNSASYGVGIYNTGDTGTVNLTNSIIANSTGGGDVYNSYYSGVNTYGTNIVEDGSVRGAINLDPNLSPLQDNGGGTLTHIPLEGSLAIDLGDNSVLPADTQDIDGDGDVEEPLPFDQRGLNRVIGDAVDLGAVETGNNGGSGNQAPVAEDDTASTGSNTALNQNVLSNDSDAEGDSLTVSAVNGEESNVGSELTLASGALLTLNADGSFEYDPNNAFDNLAEGETTTDRFSYTVSDGNDGTDTANVAIDITGVPVPSFNLDVDNNGVADPFTDGLTIFRFLGGLNPETYELASDADRSVTAVQEFLFGGETFLDVDNNGVADPFTDGLTIFRFLGGLNPETYELASDADRSVAEIQEFLQPFLDAV
ncbi:Ig-like domain-containing protein [Dactylococcopsis salina]|uniref:Ig-like domain-containing protein n=1 Tax=Dactylococcopsis salina TaxID=292566 RepID=UPI0002FAE03B|nr:Ig-like domain-containing protein [Dactylococcopsis salina]